MDPVLDLRKSSTPTKPSSDSAHTSPTSEKITWDFTYEVSGNKIYFYFLMAAFFAVGILTVWYFRNYSFGALLVACATVGLLFSRQERKARRILIDKGGISIDKEKYLYRNIKSFWIHYSPGGIKELSIETKKLLSSYLIVPLEGTHPVDLRKFLVKYIPEKEHEPSLIDMISRRLGV